MNVKDETDISMEAVHQRNRVGDGLGFLLDSLKARPVARRMLSGLSVLLAVVGVGLLAYPFYTNLVQSRIQGRLAIQLASPELKQAYASGLLEEGDSLTRLRIPAVDVDVVVVEGTSASALKAGAGHYPNTPLPGEEGNVGIAGHRTTYGKPFANLDHLKPGDEIILDTPIGRHVYKITREPFVVDKTDFSVISQTSGHALTLTTCHPKGSAKQRLVTKAEMVPDAIGA
jgi:sortase A